MRSLFSIIYRNVLKPGRSAEDVKRWLKKYWPDHQRLGATEIYAYQPIYFSEAGVFYVQYRLKSLDKYLEGIGSPECGEMLKSLGEIVDAAQTTAQVMIEIPV